MPEGYHEALLRRLQMIQDLGDSANMIAASKQSSYTPQALNNGLASAGLNSQSSGNKGFDSFLKAISSQESGGNYGAVNKSSGALGKYQIMPGNINGSKRGWDYEALGRDVSISEFLKSPQIQEAIARAKLQSYYNKWGAAGAAVAWYAGPGTVSGYLSNPGRYTNPQGAYPSIASYVNSVLGRMR